MDIFRRDFSRGWLPSADAVNCPKNALLRMDNCVLDELGIVSLRKGSAKINSVALTDTDIHSLFTAILNGTRYRMAGAGADIYANGSSLSQTMAGSGDVAFGSAMGQIFFARSTSKKKYDGTTVRNWGIAQPNAAPTLAANATDSKTFSACNTADYANWTQNEGTKTDRTTYIELVASATTARGTITKTFTNPTDFTVYDVGATAAVNDLLQFYFLITEPQLLQQVQVQIDVNSGDFTTDYYSYTWKPTEPIDISALQPPFSPPDIESLYASVQPGMPYEYALQQAQAAYAEQLRIWQESIQQAYMKSQLSSTEFNVLAAPKSAFARIGSTAGKNWSTVKAIRFTVVGSATITTGFKTIVVQGGTTRPLTGKYKYRYVFVRNASNYQIKSKPSAISTEIELKSQNCAVTIPIGALAAMDSQVNEIWLYRLGGTLDYWYRVGTTTDVADPVAITDSMSDQEALTLGMKLELDNDVPPDNIIGVEGLHFDRMFVLTSTKLYPSRKLNPDSYAAGQVITICGSDETAYWVVKHGQELLVGTSRDIYRISGAGDELTDGSLDFAKIPLGIGNPPISSAFAREGESLIYLAADGWRVFLGSNSQPVRGDLDLLWRGYTRHGVSPINISSSSARFRAALAGGIFTALTPEGSNTSSSSVLHRLNIVLQRWYRHTYTPAWRSIYREPDGTLIAGDSSGFVWQLDTGTQDNGADIPVVIRSGLDDNDQPYSPKKPLIHRIRLETNGNTATVALHFDGSEAASESISASESSMGTTETDCTALDEFKHVQHRITGSFSTFRLFDWRFDYKERPAGRKVWDIDIDTGGQVITWIREYRIKVLAGGALTVTPYFDGVAQTAYTATPTSTEDPVIISVPVGREHKGRAPRLKVTSSYEFFPYWVDILYKGTGGASSKQRQRINAA
jgi:hypothetical protein